jgi:hypothetical protein
VLGPKPSRLTYAVLLLSVLMVLAGSAEAGESGTRETITVDFDSSAAGELPEGFSTALTGGGGPAMWRVVEDARASSGGKVLAQTSTDQAPSCFPHYSSVDLVALHSNPGPVHTFVQPDTLAFVGLIDFGDAYIGHPALDWRWPTHTDHLTML